MKILRRFIYLFDIMRIKGTYLCKIGASAPAILERIDYCATKPAVLG